MTKSPIDTHSLCTVNITGVVFALHDSSILAVLRHDKFLGPDLNPKAVFYEIIAVHQFYSIVLAGGIETPGQS